MDSGEASTMRNFQYIDTEVEDSELYCYDSIGRISVVSQASCRMDVTRLEQCAYTKLAVL